MAFSLFTLVFLICTLPAFYLLRKDLRPYLLLIASLFYVGKLSITALACVVLFSALTYALGILIDFFKESNNNKGVKSAVAAGVLLTLLTLILFKYIQGIGAVLADSLPSSGSFLQKIAMPLGISYYAFQAISYFIDLYKGKAKAIRNPAYLLLYMTFFPKFASGPIERSRDFALQIDRLKNVKLFENGRFSIAATYILYGYFLKTVVADRIGIYTPLFFDGYYKFSSLWLIIGALMYTMQIYCDFAGYSALAVGIAGLFGIDLSQNFTAPYLSKNISEFWRRWHRSLSFWFRDYVYIPLGGNRKGIIRKCINTIIVFVLCGLWHGKGLNFLVWGLLHGIYSAVYISSKKLFSGKRLPVITSSALTFIAVSFAWIFFGASGLRSAIGYVCRMFTAGSAGMTFAQEMEILGISMADILFLIACIIAVFVMDMISYRLDKPFALITRDWKYGWRYALYYVLIIVIFVFGAYGPGYDSGAFMYMTF